MSGTNGSNGTTTVNPRAEWIAKRREEAVRTGDNNMSQMHFARKGLLTEEMLFVAERERVSPELIRDEIAAGHMIIPANINHPELEPMCIGVASKCKINSNIGNSSVTSNVDEELKKLHTSVHYGADTVMDLSTGGGIHDIREAILRHSPVPIGTVPIYEAVSKRITHVVLGEDFRDVVEAFVEEILLVVVGHPLRQDRAAAADDAGNALGDERQILDEHAGVDSHVIDALLGLLLDDLEHEIGSQVFDALDARDRLVDGHGADGHRRVAQDGLTDVMNAAAG